MARSLVLVTIPASHYCEKARWALDRAGIDYREEGHVPFFSRFATWRRGEASSVPVLLTSEGVVRDSTEILHWADLHLPVAARLFPAEPELLRDVEEWEELCDVELGPHTRRLAYGYLLTERALATEVVTAGVGSALERGCVRVGYSMLARTMRRGMKIDDAGMERSRARVRALFAAVGERLADGRRALAGERFTAADLAFASLAAPVLLPPEYGARLPELAEVDGAMREFAEELRAHAAGRFALSMYREQRRARAG